MTDSEKKPFKVSRTVTMYRIRSAVALIGGIVLGWMSAIIHRAA